MRRRVIEDSAPQRKAEAQADAQINSLDDIGRRLDDQQASTDLISDVVETKSNEIIKSVEDVSADTIIDFFCHFFKVRVDSKEIFVT